MVFKKYCPCCKKNKKFENFNKCKSRKDELECYCKTCRSEKAKRNYHLLLDKCSCGRTKQKKSKCCKKCYKNEKVYCWKGDKVGYWGLHLWVKKHKKKPKLCEECNIKKPFDVANISGKYLRDIDDYEWLCRKCHQISDGRLNNRDKKGKFRR